MKVGVVIVCAGKGQRLKKNVDKAFVRVKGAPLFYYSYRTFRRIKEVFEIVIVARRKYFPLIRRYAKDKGLVLAEGGKRRQDSVYSGLASLNSGIDYVIIHDGARPFVSTESIRQIVCCLKKYPAVTLGLPVKEALKMVRNGLVKQTLDRSNIYTIQTPQGFNRKVLLKAYQKLKDNNVYDETEIVEQLGKPIKVIEGDPFNIKITYPEDLVLAKAIARHKN